MHLFFNEIKRELRPLKILIVIIITFFIISYYSLIFSAEEMSYSTLEILQVTIILASTTSLYSRYKNIFFVKMNKMQYSKKIYMKLSLFWVLFAEGILIIVIYILTLYVASILNIVDSNSFIAIGNDGAIELQLLWSESKNSYLFFIYAIILEIVLIILFSYTVNHFIRNRNVLIGTVFLIIFYSMWFGNVIAGRMSTVDIDEVTYLVVSNLSLETLLNAIFLPWNQVGMIAKFSLNDEFMNVNWFDYSQMGAYKILLWTPYFSILFILFITCTFMNQEL